MDRFASPPALQDRLLGPLHVEALLLADRVLVLDGGRLATELVIDHPRPREPGDLVDQRAQLLAVLGVDAPSSRTRTSPTDRTFPTNSEETP